MPRELAKAAAKVLTIELVQKRPFLSRHDEWGYRNTNCLAGNLMRPWQATCKRNTPGS